MKYQVGDLISIILDNVERIGLILGIRQVQDTGCIIFDYQILVSGITVPFWAFEGEIMKL